MKEGANHGLICSYRKEVLGVETTLELWRPEGLKRRIEAASERRMPPPPDGTVCAGIVAPTEACGDIDGLLEATSEDARGIDAAWVLGRAAFGRGTQILPPGPGQNSYMVNAFWLVTLPVDAPGEGREAHREELVYSPTGGVVLIPAERNSG